MSIEEHLKALEKLDDEGKKDYISKLDDYTITSIGTNEIIDSTISESAKLEIISLLPLIDTCKYYVIESLSHDEELDDGKLKIINEMTDEYEIYETALTLSSDSAKIKVLPLLKYEWALVKVISSFTSPQNRLDEMRRLNDSNKITIINSFKSEQDKLKGISMLSPAETSEFTISRLTSALSHDKELDAGKIEIIKNKMTKDQSKANIILTLSSDSAKQEVINEIEEEYFLYEIIKSLSFPQNRLKEMGRLDDGHKIMIINSLKEERDKLRGISMLSDELTISKQISTLSHDEELDAGKIEILKTKMTNDYYKADIIITLSSDSAKQEVLNEIEEENNIYRIIVSFTSDENRLKEMGRLNNDYNIKQIIKSLLTLEKDKLAGIRFLSNNGNIYEMLSSLSRSEELDSGKLDIIEKMQEDYWKYESIETLSSYKSKLEAIKSLEDEFKKYQIVESFQTKELKLEALSVFDDESYIDKILKQYSSDEEKLNAIEAIEDITSKIIIIGRLSSEDLKNKAIKSLDNYETAMKSLIAKGKLNYLLFEKNILEKVFNDLEIKIIEKYKSIDQSIKKQYQEYIANNFNSITSEMIDLLPQILYRLCYSNSTKLAHLYEELATSILQSANPLEKIEEIEQIYLSNHLPDVAKTYAVFRVFHTQKDGNIEISNRVASPFLKSEHNQNFREMAIFSDLIKASIDSNSKSIRDYIKVVVEGDKLYKDILNDREINVNDEEIQQKLNYYSRVLIALHNNSLKGREKPYQSTGDVLTDIGVCTKLLSRNDSLDYDMPNRITRMFLHFAGFDTIEELTKYMDEKVQKTNDKNKDFSKDGTKLHKGQLIKGLKSVDYLHFNLQNGCVASDFLGSKALKSGDATPLDIDVGIVMDDEIDIDSGINKSCAAGYGPPWIIVDTDNEFYDSTDNPKYQKGKYELFSAKQFQNDWYGVRTGFGSTNIRCIIVYNYTEKIGFEIALAGFYIPVKNRQGKLLFSYEDYEKLVAKMAGLKHYDKPEFAFSPNLATPEIDNLKREKIADKERVTTLGNAVKKKIYEAISSFEFLPGKNLTPKGVIDGDLTAGFVEVIDTGSTGRETNAPGDGDFDFMLRIDNDILRDSDKMNKLRRTLCETFGVDSRVIDGKGELRIKGVEISPDYKVDVDISFKPKTDEINYSTDMCLKDRLSSIKKQDPEKYEYVVANICYAKKALQEAGCYYKHGHSKCTGKGGLGGVGVENWILQNGGSFVDAARSFLEAAYNEDKTEFVSWNEFKEKYKVWDFGENFREGRYDEFIHDNMDQAGYEAMRKYLKEYILKYNSNLSKNDLETMLTENTELNTVSTNHSQK